MTALGTSLTLKLLSDKPIFAPRYGVYSHRLLDMWLAGGASNSGGAALLAHFPPDEIEALTPLIDPEADTGFDYYPLTGKGERFPIADPDLPPRMAPRPESREMFLQAILEGTASIEALGYRRLAELGAPALVSMRTVGGGARNSAWTRIRARKLGVPFIGRSRAKLPTARRCWRCAPGAVEAPNERPLELRSTKFLSRCSTDAITRACIVQAQLCWVCVRAHPRRRGRGAQR